MDQNIKIGGNDAAGFLFCGRVSPGVLTWLENQSRIIYHSICDSLNKAIMNYEHFDDYYFPMYLKSRDVHRLANGKCILEQDEIDIAKARMRDECKRKVNKYSRYKKGFRSILDTDVIEEYKSVLPEEQGAQIIIFAGSYPVNKSFWTIEECDRQPMIKRDVDMYDRMAGRNKR